MAQKKRKWHSKQWQRQWPRPGKPNRVCHDMGCGQGGPKGPLRQKLNWKCCTSCSRQAKRKYTKGILQMQNKTKQKKKWAVGLRTCTDGLLVCLPYLWLSLSLSLSVYLCICVCSGNNKWPGHGTASGSCCCRMQDPVPLYKWRRPLISWKLSQI